MQLAHADEITMTIVNNPPKSNSFSLEGLYFPCSKDLAFFLNNVKNNRVDWPLHSSGHYMIIKNNIEISIYRIHVGGVTVAIPCQFTIENGIVSDIKPVEEFQGFYIPKTIFNLSSVNVFNYKKMIVTPTGKK